CALLLLDYWPLRRIPNLNWKMPCESFFVISRLVLEKVPLLLISLASAIITLYAQRSGGAVGSLSALFLAWRLKNAVYSYLIYAVKGIWSSRLAVFYPHPENSLGWWKVVLALLFVTGITALVWCAREHRYLLVGWF